MKLEPGSAVGRYRIEAELGAGGMGAVYRARDPELGRRVAIKVIVREASPDLIERMRREARAASALSHANAATVFDVGEIDGNPYIVMELIEGRSLRALVADQAATVAAKLAVLKQIAAALAAAHDVGLVHRDVKPENVVVRTDSVAKLLDFGIAKVSQVVDASSPTALDTPADLTQTGASIGSPAYMAPEQIRGQGVDGRTDQFAWGVTAFEVLAGQLPWRGKGSSFEVAGSILHEEPLRLADLAPDVPAHVCAAIARTLAKEPGDRFEDMRALGKALEESASTTAPLSSQGARMLLSSGGDGPASQPASRERVEPGATAVTAPLVLPVRRPLPMLPIALGLVFLLGFGWIMRDMLIKRPDAGTADEPRSAPILGLNDEATRKENELYYAEPTAKTSAGAKASASAAAAGATSAGPNRPAVVRCEDKKAQDCTKDHEPWCDADGKPLTCCVTGLVATPEGRCVCAPGGVTSEAQVSNGCARAAPEYTPRIQKVVKANFGDLRVCYETALKQNPKLLGNVSVSFRIASDGQFYRATIAGSSTPDPTFQDCLVATFGKLRADPPPDGDMKVTYPLAFSPGEE